MENSSVFTAAKENHMLTPKNSQDFEGSLLVSMILPLLSTFWTQDFDNASNISGPLVYQVVSGPLSPGTYPSIP